MAKEKVDTIKKEEPSVRVRSSAEFKLKNKQNRNLQVVHIGDFGFIPETLIFERCSSNTFRISAVLTPKEIERVDELAKKQNDNNADTTKN